MNRRTKIVATLGPATDRADTLRQLIAAGIDTVRLNFSHGDPEDHRRRAEHVRAAATRQRRHVALLGDLQGPKIRIGKFTNGRVDLKRGADFVLDPAWSIESGSAGRVSVDYPELARDCRVGDCLLLDDGRLSLRVNKIDGNAVITMVEVGGRLLDRKGINKRGGGLAAPVLAKKDLRDIQLAAELQPDYLAFSFPRGARDIHRARKLLQEAGGSAHIVAKIECAEAVTGDSQLKKSYGPAM